ncbi:thiopeptide-type bacteriocin biosynthesis protein, partial [Streptomyces sp. SID3343]|uniref:thiopeptide-type bacteriocin biosynthesis protein n=1 Tax=Streptomyces sp. SID3343 TaxID=2690260 RepID=UPI0013C044A0
HPEYRAVRREFVSAGLAAIERSRAADTRRTRWVHVAVRPAPGADARLYARLEEVACELLTTGAAADFFFVHKAPGLRIRFALHGDAATSARLRELVHARVEEWQRDALVVRIEPGVYEPEEHLFGGPVSMRSVHRLFTVDSLSWLGFHAAEGESLPAWAFSLVLLRDVMDGLGVQGWEDRDVWDRVRTTTGRTLPAAVSDAWRDTAIRVRAHWRAVEALREALPDPLRALAVRHRSEARTEGERWTREYFTGGHAELGPRQALAYYTVFHWNRGRLAGPTQCLLADALAGRPQS